jgi:hypothetical protein
VALVVRGPFPFGFHVGGTEPDGTDHNQPVGTVLAFGPDGEDGLPDKEYLIYGLTEG